MIRSCSVLVLASVFQVTVGQRDQSGSPYEPFPPQDPRLREHFDMSLNSFEPRHPYLRENSDFPVNTFQPQHPYLRENSDFPLDPFQARDPREIGLYHPYQAMIPRHCWAPPRDINIYQCCPIPRLYPDDVMKSCRDDKMPLDYSKVLFRSKSPLKNCKMAGCMMTKVNVLMANKSVDYEKLRTYIDQWADANPEFKEAILTAKNACAKPPSLIPGAICEYDRIFSCLTSNILWNCKLREYDRCNFLRDHLDECKSYYMKPKDQEIQV